MAYGFKSRGPHQTWPQPGAVTRGCHGSTLALPPRASATELLGFLDEGDGMIRGAIEVAQKNRVAGWIYSSADSVRDKLILAFVGARCVGSGKVDRFRKDLLEAKLGDGYCGFEFPIKLNEGERLGAVVVRLQSSDAALIQR